MTTEQDRMGAPKGPKICDKCGHELDSDSGASADKIKKRAESNSFLNPGVCTDIWGAEENLGVYHLRVAGSR